jgi:hypothetical protein
MAEITDPQVVAFANQETRPMSDALYLAYRRAQNFVENYIHGGMGNLIDAGGTANLVADGSETDGRTRITGQDIINLVQAAQEFMAYVENLPVPTADRRYIISKPHVRDPQF